MIARSLLAALAAGLLSAASQASFAQVSFDSFQATQAVSHVEHAYRGGPKTVVPHGTVNRIKLGGGLPGAVTGARAESPDLAPAASANRNNHRYYGGPKFH